MPDQKSKKGLSGTFAKAANIVGKVAEATSNPFALPYIVAEGIVNHFKSKKNPPARQPEPPAGP